MDSIDEILSDWRREAPEIRTGAFHTMLRAGHLARVIDTFERRVLEPFEIGASEYEVLATLRRNGPPYRLNPSSLYERLNRSSGGMTKMLKRLEAGGYIERTADPEDGRGSLVVLTRRGLELQGRVLAAFVSASENRLEGLGAGPRAEIEAAMRRLAQALDRSP
jgi:DNA-binding MarR family transcriptional regulator